MTQAPRSPRIEARLATNEDLAELEANETEATAGQARRGLELQEQGDYYIVVGTVDGAIAGAAALDAREFDGSNTPELKFLRVNPESRRMGVGGAITRRLEALARELGHRHVYLGVDPENPAAIPLYVSLGYAPTGDHRPARNASVLDEGAEPATEAIYNKSLTTR